MANVRLCQHGQRNFNATLQVYRTRAIYFRFCESLTKLEFCLLPMKWVYRALALILVLAIAIGSYFGYQVMGATVTNTKPVKVRIRSGWTLHKLATALQSEVGLKDTAFFQLGAPSWI
jgi:hypothetical protein